MTDREQIRRDAATTLKRLDVTERESWAMVGTGELKDLIRALLAELEQAERRAAMADSNQSLMEAYRREAEQEAARAEQAERERDEWMTPFEGSGIHWHEHEIGWKYTYQPSDFGKLVAAVHEYEVRCLKAEAQLAKVPALVEAIAQARRDLWWFIEQDPAEPLEYDEASRRAMDIQDKVLYPALAVWGQAQK